MHNVFYRYSTCMLPSLNMYDTQCIIFCMYRTSNPGEKTCPSRAGPATVSPPPSSRAVRSLQEQEDQMLSVAFLQDCTLSTACQQSLLRKLHLAGTYFALSATE